MSIDLALSCDTCEQPIIPSNGERLECDRCQEVDANLFTRALELLEDLYRGREYPALHSDVAAFLKEHGR